VEFLHTDDQVGSDLLKTFLEDAFPARKAFPEYHDFGSPGVPDNVIVFAAEFREDVTEFGCRVGVFRTPEENCQERALFLARRLAEQLQKRVLTDFTHPDEPTYPYYNILFQNGQAFLADDSDSNAFGGSADGEVIVLGVYQLPDYRFDDYGRLLP